MTFQLDIDWYYKDIRFVNFSIPQKEEKKSLLFLKFKFLVIYKIDKLPHFNKF